MYYRDYIIELSEEVRTQGTKFEWKERKYERIADRLYLREKEYYIPLFKIEIERSIFQVRIKTVHLKPWYTISVLDHWTDEHILFVIHLLRIKLSGV